MTKNNIRNKCIAALIYGYLALPFIIFAFGWLRWYLAIIIGGLAIAGFVLCIRDTVLDFDCIFDKDNILKFAIVLFALGAWVRLSGIGSYCFQNTDHYWRNSIFTVLSNHEWPVIVPFEDGNRTLVYYIGFWLPSALVSKIAGFDIGWRFQALWAWIGVALVYTMICVWRKKVEIWPVVVFAFFSGLDYVGSQLVTEQMLPLFGIDPLEGWVLDMQFINNTSLLFWVFNQAVPAWVCTMLFAIEDTKKNILYPMACIMLSSTFPFVGMLMIAIYYCIKGYRYNQGTVVKDFVSTIRPVFSVQNIIGILPVGVTTLLYLMTNLFAANKTEELNYALTSCVMPVKGMAVAPVGTLAAYMFSGRGFGHTVWMLFCLLEFLVYIGLIYDYQKKNPMMYIVVAWMLICPFIKVGESFDFGARSVIPSQIMLILMVIDTLDKAVRDKKKYVLIGLVSVMMIGALSPIHEIQHTIVYTTTLDNTNANYIMGVIGEDTLLHGGNFSGPDDSFFFKHMAKPYEN
ncbi:MAG: hypothetical protein HUJ71_05520 [Pseudobutyrivibrio sp.]|nr:hypothetical protein [Pseudobutyrivibrio sp.]